MKVLQLIDSLDAGGAERIAVTYTNALNKVIEESFICATRKEGVLKETIANKENYLFLKKRNSFDVLALRRLLLFVKLHKINLIHAHSTSYFFASLVKLYEPNIKLIWHDHYGNSEDLHKRKFKVLRWCSSLFCTVISVNHKLENWAQENLKAKTVHYLENVVAIIDREKDEPLKLKGELGKRIVCLANLRPQKDHYNLIQAFEKINSIYPEYSLHLIGRNWSDDYYNGIINLIENLGLTHHVFYYGQQSHIHGILKKCDIGVLSSQSEGLPLALLEYGMAGLAVVTTKVGQCELVVNGYGRCVPPKDPGALSKTIINYIEHSNKMRADAISYKKHIENKFSIKGIIPKLVSYYEHCK